MKKKHIFSLKIESEYALKTFMQIMIVKFQDMTKGCVTKIYNKFFMFFFKF